MATEYLDPNSNITSVWKTYNYTNIDNGVRQPSTNTSDYIQWNKSDDDEIQAYGMSNLSSLTSITSIKVWVYGKRTSDDPDLQCRINVGGSYEDYQNFGLTSTSSWHSLTFNGTWTDTDVNALGVYFLSGSIGNFSDNKIYLVYAEITGTNITGTNIKINIGDSMKDVSEIKINIGDSWKAVTEAKINIGDVWKDVF